MDWDLKMPLWDLAELDRHAEPNLGSMVDGPSSGSALRCPVNGLECSVDLKLGGLGDPGSSYRWNEQPRISTAVVATSAPSKRQRTSGDGSQFASCLVDGCKADLSKLRDYHRRHKVCEVHSKTPVVLVHGQEQRFCQQCSRFHMLAEFDEVKRSCRKRLDGHNRRRRKPQPNSVISGTRLMSAYPAQVFQSATTEPNWPPVIKIEDNARYLHQPGPDLLYRNPFFHNSSLSYSRERKHLPFLQESETSLSSITTIGSLVGRAHLMTSVPSGIGGGGCSSSSSRSQMSATGVVHAFHSDGAFSLLSSPRQASSIDVSRIMQSAHQICVGQPLVSSSEYGDLLHYSHSAAAAAEVASSTGYSCSGMGDAGAGRTALVSSATNGADAQCSLFRMGEGGSPDGASQALPFSWQQ